MGFSPSQLDLLSIFKIKVLHLDSFFEQVSMQCQAPDVQNWVHQESCPWEAYYIGQCRKVLLEHFGGEGEGGMQFGHLCIENARRGFK